MPEVEYLNGGGVALVDGQIIPVGGERMSPSEISKQIRNVVALPYKGKNAELLGMTMLEAALYSAAKAAADGDIDALNKLLDRLLGKPVQQTITATGTLKDFLEQIAQNERVGVTPVDTQGVLDD